MQKIIFVSAVLIILFLNSCGKVIESHNKLERNRLNMFDSLTSTLDSFNTEIKFNQLQISELEKKGVKINKKEIKEILTSNEKLEREVNQIMGKIEKVDEPYLKKALEEIKKAEKEKNKELTEEKPGN